MSVMILLGKHETEFRKEVHGEVWRTGSLDVAITSKSRLCHVLSVNFVRKNS